MCVHPSLHESIRPHTNVCAQVRTHVGEPIHTHVSKHVRVHDRTRVHTHAHTRVLGHPLECPVAVVCRRTTQTIYRHLGIADGLSSTDWEEVAAGSELTSSPVLVIGLKSSSF